MPSTKAPITKAPGIKHQSTKGRLALSLTLTESHHDLVALVLVDVQALKTLVLVRQHKVDGAQADSGVALAVIVDLDLLQDRVQHRVPGWRDKELVPTVLCTTLLRVEVAMTRWGAFPCLCRWAARQLRWLAALTWT